MTEYTVTTNHKDNYKSYTFSSRKEAKAKATELKKQGTFLEFVVATFDSNGELLNDYLEVIK